MKIIVTIIIPTYKGKDTILRAVNSALNQTYNNLQVIVVDDNGRGTKEQLITQKLLQNYIYNNKILYIAHEKNSNGSIARNTGLKYAIGEYICFLDDDDDEFLPTKTKIQVELLNNTNSNIGMVVSSYKIKLPNGYYQDMILCQPNDFLFEYLIHTMQACSSAIMMKKSVFNKVKE
ncbi:glycosyltransferase family 2 protein [uncultured Clostridium sp.]|uniref:glycosyltransferase family 2 protein n=1 Tax=uncultured Clostridium sp. TaxID=59620 RepID=UPI00341F17BD